MHKFLPVLVICFLSTSCSEVASRRAMPERAPIIEGSDLNGVEVFMSRSDLNNTEFEHYKLTKSGLFTECGTVKKGRYYPKHQDVLELDEDESENLHNLSKEYLEYASGSNVRLPEPGKNSNLFDPGIFTLTLFTGNDSHEVATSVDGISEPTTTAARKLRSISSSMRRAAGSRICGNREFYGIK